MALPFMGTTDIPTAGTRVQISNTSRICASITVKARNGNTGSIYVGTSNVSSSNGVELRANEALTINGGAVGIAFWISDIWLDTATNGNDADFWALLKP